MLQINQSMFIKKKVVAELMKSVHSSAVAVGVGSTLNVGSGSGSPGARGLGSPPVTNETLANCPSGKAICIIQKTIILKMMFMNYFEIAKYTTSDNSSSGCWFQFEATWN
jgi:hypothetical protein